jgi:hypothetical protein
LEQIRENGLAVARLAEEQMRKRASAEQLLE